MIEREGRMEVVMEGDRIKEEDGRKKGMKGGWKRTGGRGKDRWKTV